MAFGFSNWFGRRRDSNNHGGSGDSFAANNPNYQAFSNIDADIAAVINARSVVSKNVERENGRYANPSWQLFFNNDLMAMPIASNKAERINQYRRISKYLI